MKDIREYRSAESIYDELETINERMLYDIKQIFKERGITTLRVLADDEGRNWSDANFDCDEAYDNSPLIYIDYIDDDMYPAMGLIYEVSVTDEKGISVCLYNEDCDRCEYDFEFGSKDILDIYGTVLLAVMRNEID